MTIYTIHEIFRYHRKISDVSKANPHRFRHTFGADMVMAGISLPILMRLMGHTHIQTTMRYVNVSVQDIQQEFQKAVTKLKTKEAINGTTSFLR
jgi:site-specific recombinase XerD